MKRITEIEASLKALQPKLAIDAKDWTKSEKEHIEKCYHAITKESVGWGRTVDLGCEECVTSAVNIIKNYQAQVASQPQTTEAPEWAETLKTIQAEADSLGFEFAKEQKTKAQRIAALQAFIDTLPTEKVEEEGEMSQSTAMEADDEDLLGEDLLGAEYTREQLVNIVKAKTGEDVPEETSFEDLLAYVNDLEDGEDEGTDANA
jgi:hypothetical protein